MEAIHVKNLEKYHPGYKDRELIWCKVYFKMLNADPAFEMLCEIDKWRLIAFIMLELQIKKSVPIDTKYLTRKGFDLKKRPISLTIQMLQHFINCVTQDEKLCSVDKSRVEESRGDREKFTISECVYCANISGLTEQQGKDFFDHYNAQGWLLGNGQPITHLSSAMARWRAHEHEHQHKDTLEEQLERIRRENDGK